jgi:hypothetical protein
MALKILETRDREKGKFKKISLIFLTLCCGSRIFILDQDFPSRIPDSTQQNRVENQFIVLLLSSRKFDKMKNYLIF